MSKQTDIVQDLQDDMVRRIMSCDYACWQKDRLQSLLESPEKFHTMFSFFLRHPEWYKEVGPIQSASAKIYPASHQQRNQILRLLLETGSTKFWRAEDFPILLNSGNFAGLLGMFINLIEESDYLSKRVLEKIIRPYMKPNHQSVRYSFFDQIHAIRLYLRDERFPQGTAQSDLLGKFAELSFKDLKEQKRLEAKNILQILADPKRRDVWSLFPGPQTLAQYNVLPGRLWQEYRLFALGGALKAPDGTLFFPCLDNRRKDRPPEMKWVNPVVDSELLSANEQDRLLLFADEKV